MTKKQILLEKLKEAHGIVSVACTAAKISRFSFYEWKKKDPKFAAAYEDIMEEQIDMVESHFFDTISGGGKGACAAQIFYLKTRAKDRGYVEKIENEHSGDLTININQRVIK